MKNTEIGNKTAKFKKTTVYPRWHLSYALDDVTMGNITFCDLLFLSRRHCG